MKSLEEKFNKKLPFKVPEGYFDSLPLRVQERIASTETQSTPKGKWIALRSQLAFAAGFAFMVMLSYLGYYMARPLIADKKTAKTDYVEIVSRTIYEFDDIDLYQAIEQKRKTDSLKESFKEMPHRLYVRSNNCITIIDEKEEIKP